MLSTVTPSRPAARALNWRTLSAHTPVSMLGKTLSTRLPAKLLSATSASLSVHSVAGGASLPTAGRSPTVWMGFPFSVIAAMWPPG